MAQNAYQDANRAQERSQVSPGELKGPRKTLFRVSKKTCLSKGTGSAFKRRALQRHVLKCCITCSNQREQSRQGGPIKSSGLRPRLAARPRPRRWAWKQRSQKRLNTKQNTSNIPKIIPSNLKHTFSKLSPQYQQKYAQNAPKMLPQSTQN